MTRRQLWALEQILLRTASSRSFSLQPLPRHRTPDPQVSSRCLLSALLCVTLRSLSVALNEALERPAFGLSMCLPCTQPSLCNLQETALSSLWSQRPKGLRLSALMTGGAALTQVCGLCRRLHAAVSLPVCLQLRAGLQSFWWAIWRHASCPRRPDHASSPLAVHVLAVHADRILCVVAMPSSPLALPA